MSDLNLLDLLRSDIFCEIQRFLRLKDFFVLRCVSTDMKNYVDQELVKLKALKIPAQDDRMIEAFKLLSEKCCMLETINLSRNVWLQDDMLLGILNNNAGSLKTLNLSHCSSLTAAVLQPVIIGCPNLKKLSLQSCHWLTIGCLEAMAFHHTNIEDLDLKDCPVHEQCLFILLNNFRKLRVLSLASISSINDNVLFMISKYQEDIVHLNLFGCKLITDRGIGALSLNCRKLETLSIRGCNITERSLKLLRARNVHIDVPRNTPNAFINQFQRYSQLNQNLFLQV